jgi:hypothetical protein
MHGTVAELMLARLQEVAGRAKPSVQPERSGWRDPVLHGTDGWSRKRKVLVASLAAGLLAWPLVAVRADSLPDEAASFIEDKVRSARTMSNGRKALAFCRSAKNKARQHDRSAFYDGLIAACVAGAEFRLVEQHRTAACNHLRQATVALREVSADHPDYDILKADVETAQLGAAKLSCRPSGD